MLLMNILPLFAGLASLIMAVIVMLSKRRGDKYPFVVFALGMGVWAILITAFLLSGDSVSAELIARCYYVAAAVIFYGLLLFCLSFTGADTSEKLIRNSLLLLIPIALISWIIFLPRYISVQGIEDGIRIVRLDPLSYAAYCVYIVTYLALSCVQLVKILSDKRVSKQKKSQVRMIELIVFICIPFGGLFNLVLPYLGNYELIMMGPLAILPVVGIIFYAIKQHGLFDIKLAAVRSVAYLMSLLALAAIYYVAAYFISITIFSSEVTTSFSISPLNIFLALILAFIFQPIKHFFDQATDKIFYRDRYDSEAFYSRLSEILTAESTDLRKFLSRIAEEIGTTLRAEVAFLHVQWGHHHAAAGNKGRVSFSDSDIETIRMYVLENQSDIIVADILPEKDPIRRLLSRRGIAIAVPLVQKSAVFGYLFLGDRRSGEYSTRDKKVLETISNELVVAVQNALSLQEIRDFNVHLQQRIEAATSELVASNEKLKRLDAAKDEFVSMASHQLRTPLTSVKGYISMVLEGDAGKITPMQRQILGEAFMSSERMVHLIGDFLNVSRLQTGKFVLDKHEMNLADLVQEQVDALQATAKTRSLRLKYRRPSVLPTLYADDGKIQQVVMNFIDNAIYYSTEDTVITVKLSVEGGYVVFTVSDTGIGVPKNERAQLFTKFFRATNARRQRPDGTGIGLYLAKKVIDAHDGTMVFESKEGKGSTFGFRLPIKKLSEKPVEATNEI